MDIQKWDYDLEEYQKYNPDPQWNVSYFSIDMELEINCAQCGKEMLFGEGYTSKEIHTSVGFGYSVCSECYLTERNRQLEMRTS